MSSLGRVISIKYKLQSYRPTWLFLIPHWESQLISISRLKLCQMPSQYYIRRSSTCFLPALLSSAVSTLLTIHSIVRSNQLDNFLAGTTWQGSGPTIGDRSHHHSTAVHVCYTETFKVFQTSVNRMTRSGKNEDMWTRRQLCQGSACCVTSLSPLVIHNITQKLKLKT